jgi:uncharacterized membrane protein HdeD (DUF308 family)
VNQAFAKYRYIVLGGVVGILLNILVIVLLPDKFNISFQLAVPGVVGFFVSGYSMLVQEHPPKTLIAIIEGILAVFINGVLLLALSIVVRSPTLTANVESTALEPVAVYILPGVVFSILGGLLRPNRATMLYGVAGNLVLGAVFLLLSTKSSAGSVLYGLIIIISGLAGILAAVSSRRQNDRRPRAILQGIIAGLIATIFANCASNSIIQALLCGELAAPCNFNAIYIYFFYFEFAILPFICGAIGGILGAIFTCNPADTQRVLETVMG